MNLISVRDLNKNIVNDIIELSKEIDSKNNLVCKKDRIIGTLFFEPSTRTKLSFQSAIKRLNLKNLDFNANTSSIKKGESFIDTIKTIDNYVDLFVIRHKYEGVARLVSEISAKPVINAGDGSNQHPTQALIDLYTIFKNLKNIENKNIFLFGDLKHARTIKSLIYLLAMFKANIYLKAPKGLELSSELIDELKTKFDANIIVEQDLNLKDKDVLYVCRIQKERYEDPYEVLRVQKEFFVSKNILKNVKDNFMILHPLPKVNEIDLEIDNTKYAFYFKQAKNGVPVRMAIIKYLLNR